MVYDCWHATPEDHGNHRGLGAANRRGCGFVCSECAEFRNLPNLDDHITLSNCAYLWKLGLAVARESQLQGSLFIGFEDWSLAVRDIVNYGVLPGLVLGLINYFFFFTYRYSPLVAPRIREIQSPYDSFVVSLDSGGYEEVVFRLFILSCFLFSFRQLYSRVARLWPGVVAILPKALSIVLSSLLFAMVHNIYGFTAAFFGGMLLGLIYIQSGIESAIAAHFCANFLFFSASYLS